jgi:hypothetical protein
LKHFVSKKLIALKEKYVGRIKQSFTLKNLIPIEAQWSFIVMKWKMGESSKVLAANC